MNTFETQKYNKILLLFPMFCALKYCLTFTDDYPIFGLTQVFIVGVLGIFVLSLISPNFSNRFYKKNIVFLALYIAILFFFSMYVADTESITNLDTYTKKLLMLFVFWGMYNQVNLFSQKEKKFFALIFFICIFISTVYTLYVALTIGSDMVRQTTVSVYSDEIDNTYGGYDFIYILVLVYISVALSYKNHKNNVTLGMKIFVYAFFVLSFLTVICSGFGTALLLMVFGTVFWGVKTKSKFIILLFLMISVLLLPNALIELIENLFIIPSLTKSRIIDIINLLSGNTLTTEQYADRFAKMRDSLDVFIKYPIFGGVTRVGAFDFGRHTEWLDQLARYGLISFVFYVAFWANSKKHIVNNVVCGKEKNEIDSINTNKVFILFFIMGLILNFSIDSIAAPLFLFTPFVNDMFLKKEVDKLN